MSENMEALVEAGRLLAKMKQLVVTYEAAKIANSEGLEIDLTAEQVTSLKSKFAAARTACKAELDKVVG